MKIYLLINLRDTDGAFGANAVPFADKEAAQAAMQKDWEETVKTWKFDKSIPATDEHYYEYEETSAVVHDSNNEEHWRIEEHEIAANAAVEVGGGLVRNVYANIDLDVEVYDLDVSDFPDEGEQEAADAKEEELAALIKSPGWGRVW